MSKISPNTPPAKIPIEYVKSYIVSNTERVSLSILKVVDLSNISFSSACIIILFLLIAQNSLKRWIIT
jgi:hypothetical protein